MNKYLKFILAIIICEAAGLVGSLFTFNSITTWYVALNKPFFNPPSWIFAPVWTTLYLLMGASLYLVWKKKKANLNWFWTQLVLNTVWSIVFFGLRNPLLAFFVVIFLWFGIFKTIKDFGKINKTASYILYPYLAWVSFAAVLNLSIVILNKSF